MSQETAACWRWRKPLSLLALGELDTPTSEALKVHLESCQECRKHLAGLQALGTELHKMGKALPDIEPPETLGLRWQSALAKSGPLSEATRAGGLAVTWAERLTDWALPHSGWWPGLAAAWGFILLLRLLSPDVSTPPASNPGLRLDQVVSILQTARTPPTSDSRSTPTDGALRPLSPGVFRVAFRHAPPPQLSAASCRKATPEDAPQPELLV